MNLPATQPRSLAALLVFLACTFAAAGIGAMASVQAASVYGQLQQPTWAPPAAVFGPVWSTLYLLMAVAGWLVWRRGPSPAVRRALVLFGVQLMLNALWSWLFFGWRLGVPSVIDIVLLWVAIVATLVAFWRIHRLAGALLVPYLLWVSFAMALNVAIVRLNPQGFSL
jgi:benzodiazapine receptor